MVALMCSRCGEHSAFGRIQQTITATIPCRCPTPSVTLAFFSPERRLLNGVALEETRIAEGNDALAGSGR